MKTNIIFYPVTILVTLLFTNISYGQFCAQVGGDQNDTIFKVHRVNTNITVVTGQTDSFGNGKSDMYCTAFSNNGTQLWSNAYGHTADDFFGSSLITSNSQLVIAGTLKEKDSFSKIPVFRIRQNGSIRWRTLISLETYNLSASKVIQAPGGNIIVIGNKTKAGHLDRLFMAILNGNDGSLISSGSINILSSQRVEDAILTSDNKIAVVATNLNGGGFFFYIIGSNPTVITKLSVRHPSHTRHGHHIPRRIIETDDLNFMVVGGKSDVYENFSYGFVMKVNKLGEALQGVNIEGTTSTTTVKGNMLESIHQVSGTSNFIIAGELDKYKYLADITSSFSLANSNIYGQEDSKLFDAVSVPSGNVLAGGVDPKTAALYGIPEINGAIMTTLPDLTNCCVTDQVGTTKSGTCETEYNFKLIESEDEGEYNESGASKSGGISVPVCLPTSSRSSINQGFEAVNMEVYPNPAKNSISIKLDEDLTGKEYQIYSMNGKLLIGNVFSKKSTEINTQSLPTGTYILKVKGAYRVYSHHLVITK
ncbi:T9SS type A sorting domain-containing protein [uncultured Kordia sp.]|uniref:T9SS type A sorting domain-containing protein n=1 Tax=uncultured Kordia sp. TaxID=507699 RepID=UPI0026360DC3|nr:T9SS type A sorting domain-containing protein [uncultured Kordia sp.]